MGASKRIIVLCVCVLTGCGHAGPKQLTFFPSAANYDDQKQQWEAPVHGWVYQGRRWGLLRKFAWKWMQGYLEDAQREGDTSPSRDAHLQREREEVARKLFDDRAGLFVVDGRAGNLVVVEFGNRKFVSPPTDNGGRFAFTVKLNDREAQELLVEGSVPYHGYIFEGPVDKALELVSKVGEAVAPEATQQAKSDMPTPLKQEHERNQGYVRLVRPGGVAVISDIDDTIKISDVLDRRAFIRRMFLEPFVPVPGMPEVYQRWASHGAEIFYVSASPWQLYSTLSAFTQESKFPPGVFSMKRVGILDAYMSNLWTSALQVKTEAIEEVFKRFPDRRFVLVGDSTEHDFEIYGEAARKHPGQVLHIFIRDVRQEGETTPRFVGAFRDVPREKWSLFDSGADLPAELTEDVTALGPPVGSK